MKLTYRGVTYETNPVVLETVQTEEVTGKYRGQDWRFRNLKKAPIMMPVTGLKYRGVSYEKAGNLPNQETPDTSSLTIENRARSLMFGHTHTIKKRQQSMLARAAATIGLDKKSNDYWGRIQGKVHPTFRFSYDRVGATMS